MECLQLILAVLKPKQAVEDLMEEGKEEDEESEEESKESESESSGSEEGEREGGGVDPAFAQEVRRALGVAAAVDSNEEVCVMIRIYNEETSVSISHLLL